MVGGVLLVVQREEEESRSYSVFLVFCLLSDIKVGRSTQKG
jgi:hypothetical protein